MSSKRHHAEWLNLIPTSGPFLTMPILEKVFPQGLDAHDPDLSRSLRVAYEEWEESQNSHRPNPATHVAWIKFVLTQTLGFPNEVLAEGQAVPQTLKATISEHGETLRPDFVIQNPEGVTSAGKARLLVQIYPLDQSLEKPVAGKHWKASPGTRMMELLHSTDVRLGIVTNGEHWMLVDAPKSETTGFASWYAHLWLEEKLTLQAFRSLLSVNRFFSVPDDQTLEAMLAESATHQQEVTDQLGLQVRHAVEVLIESLDRADQDHGRELLASVPETVLYEAALTVMMRLVFLFSAEERDLLLLGDPLYDQHYAVSTLVAQLQEAADQHGEEVLERRLDAWVRLLSTFRGVYGGVEHERMKLPPYAGNLFNPDRFPFIEGRKPGTSWRDTPAQPLPVENRTVLHLLRSLQYLEMQGEARRLSFRSLDIEQIGHVYEGLLDHTAKRATEPMLGLVGAKGMEPEVALSELERRRAKGEDQLIEFLEEETGRSASGLKRALVDDQTGTPRSQLTSYLRVACGNDGGTFQRVLPFAGLIRSNTFGKPVVIRKGSVFVTAGTDRRSSGTHYTPRSLTEPVVQYTLEPLVYVGPAEGKPKEEWKLRSPRELLGLKICDMACGSGAFLVQACRYLSELLLEVWENAEAEHSGVPGITPEGNASTGAKGEVLIPKDADERLVYAQRLVAHQCLYGVDKNPLAVEMAKLSLWLLTLAKDRPFTFLDHAIRSGDSLVGISDLKQLAFFSLDQKGAQATWYSDPVTQLVEEAVNLREKIEGMPSNSVEDVETQSKLLTEAEERTARLRYAADLLFSVEFQPASSAGQKGDLRDAMAIQAGHYVSKGTVVEFRQAAQNALSGQPTFHWPLEFPEIFVDQGGFGALVCNPPFMGGQKITGNLGTAYRDYLVERLAGGKRGSADLCAYLRAKQLLRSDGQFGFLATNTIAQGDTREVGLEQLAVDGCCFPRAVPSRKWPGTASLEVAHVWVRRGKWSGPHVLDELPTNGITAFLTVPGTVTGKPFRLRANESKSFIGSYVLGMGFIMEPEEAQRLIQKEPRNKDVLFPYLNGEDLNSRLDQSPRRWVINFKDWPLDRSASGKWISADEDQRRSWLRSGHVPGDYPEPVAADYPDCLNIVDEKVKPERTRRKANGEFALRYPLPQKWWIYAEKRPALYATIAGLERVLVVTQTSKYHSFVFVPNRMVYAHKLVVFTAERWAEFALLNSTFHALWVFTMGSTLETRPVYTPSDCFETFPFASPNRELDSFGMAYYEHRRQIMTNQKDGLTDIYNCFHDQKQGGVDIHKLRDLQVQMDNAVAAAYSWDDLNLGHGFHETKQGIRFTISEAARREVLARLLKLNHERYAEEVRQGLQRGTNGRGKRRDGSASGLQSNASKVATYLNRHQAQLFESHLETEPHTFENANDDEAEFC